MGIARTAARFRSISTLQSSRSANRSFCSLTGLPLKPVIMSPSTSRPLSSLQIACIQKLTMERHLPVAVAAFKATKRGQPAGMGAVTAGMCTNQHVLNWSSPVCGADAGVVGRRPRQSLQHQNALQPQLPHRLQSHKIGARFVLQARAAAHPQGDCYLTLAVARLIPRGSPPVGSAPVGSASMLGMRARGTAESFRRSLADR